MSQHTRTPTSTTSYHNHTYRSFHYPSSNASTHSREPVSPILPSDRFPTPRSYNDAYDLRSTSPFVSPIMSRTPSVAGSDRYSTISGVTGYWPQNPDNVSPAAAYVAPFGAVQVVNEHRASTHGRRASDASDDGDDHDAPSKEDAQFSPQALKLINHFLDQLLYSILSTARSTNLHALRPAVTEVLRHRLAKEAVANADEELQELLAGGDEEEERNALAQVSSRDSRKWDLELVWKRTRLRVMVYMRLGEMEDDDEERHVKEQELFYGRETDSRRFSSSSGLVSWSAAIFLTSVLEYVAEQSLQAAGGVAYARARRPSVARPGSASSSKQLRVEDFDVEKLALDARLGRLWRTWRKSMRNDRQRPATSGHRSIPSKSSFTRDRALSLSALRRGSMGQPREDSMTAEEQYRSARQPYLHGMADRGYDDPEVDYPEHVLASNIPLPMRDARRDIDEIEVPGLAKYSEEDTEEGSRMTRARRNSYGSPTIERFAHQPQAEPKSAYFSAADARPSIVRQRSKSVPNQQRTPRLEMPGAFPLMPEERPTNLMQQTVPETKASAVDIDDGKHDREGSKVLLKDVGIMPRKVINGEVASPARKNTSDTPKDASSVVDQDENVPTKAVDESAPVEDHSLGLLSGVAAGASAVAGAALAAAGLSHADDKSEEKSRKEDLAPTREEPSESSDAVLPQPRDRSAEEIADLDNRKSLADVKSVMAAQGTSRLHEDSIPPVAASVAPEPEAVHEDVSVRDRDPTEKGDDSIAAADLTSMEEDSKTSPKTPKEIGHSRHDTTTMAALEAPASPSEIAEAEESARSEQKARDMPMIGSPKVVEKPARLIITGDPVATRDQHIPAPIDTERAIESSASPRSPREFLTSDDLPQDSESAQTKDLKIQSPSEQTRVVVPRPVPVASSPATPTASENNARDLKMVQADKEQKKSGSPQSRKLYGVHEKQNSGGEVQDHPAIQSMASSKRDTPGTSASVSGTSTPPVVTTASIRGPQDFDSFLQGGDTVKYTLTPENVRDERSRPPTGDTKSATKQTSHAASLAKLSSQSSEGDNTSTRNGSPSAASGQRQSRSVRQSIKDLASGTSQQDSDVVRERRRSISKPAPRNTSSLRRSGLTAREPQVLTASTRDFADFIRSTGPDREQEVKRIHTQRSTTSLQSLRNTARSQSIGASSVSSQRERTKSLTNATMAAENIPPVPRMPSSKSGSRGPPLQARDATGAASGNTDLINFIRDGPEEQGSHRISRSVAPFRNTMDSDQFDMVGDFASSAPSNPSTDVNGNGASFSRSASTVPSQPTPVHLTTSSTNGNASSQRLPAAAAEPEDDGRKRYRNKDPYALPSDSEDEDDDDDDELLTALPRNNNHRPKEESLAEFLRNNEPPADNAPRPISGPAANANIHKARTSATEPMTAEPPASRNRTTQSQSNGPQPVPQSFSPSNLNSTPRTGGPKLEARGAGAPRQRIPRGNAGARLGASEQSNTGDLADFLRSSGPAEEKSAPPPGMRSRWEDEPVEEPKKEKKKSFFSRFSSKK